MKKRREWKLQKWIVAFAAAIPRLPCIWSGFLFDDRPAIINNQDVFNSTQSWTEIFNHDFWGTNLSATASHKSYRPLTTLSFRLNAFIFNDSATAFHTCNVLIHMLNCVLVYSMLQRVLKSSNWAFYSAILFSLHPVHTEAVCGIVGRADLLWSSFALTCLLYCQSTTFVHISLTFLATFCKEQGIMIIPMTVCLLWATGKKWRFKLIICAPFLALILYLRLRLIHFSAPKFQEGDNPIGFLASFWYRCINFHYLLVLNCWILILPEWLCYDWAMGCIDLIQTPLDARILAVLLLWLSILALACRKRNHLSLCLLALPFFPSSNLLVLVGFVVAERNLYMSVLGYALLVTQGLKRLKTKKRLRKLILSFICLVFCLRSLQRGMDWMNEERLFRSAMKVCPHNAKVHYNLGKITKDPTAAVIHYERAIRLWPSYEHAMNNLGNIYKILGQYKKAEELFQRALAISPKFAACWMNLGIVQTHLGKLNEAEGSYTEALRLRSHYPDCYFNLGTLYVKVKSYKKARWAFEKAIEENPHHFWAHSNLVILLDDLQLFNQAEEKAMEALSIFEEEPDFHFHLANIYGKSNRYDQAEHHYKEATQRNPSNSLYLSNFGVLYHRWKKYDKAAIYYKRALQIDPDLKSAAHNLKVCMDYLSN